MTYCIKLNLNGAGKTLENISFAKKVICVIFLLMFNSSSKMLTLLFNETEIF